MQHSALQGRARLAEGLGAARADRSKRDYLRQEQLDIIFAARLGQGHLKRNQCHSSTPAAAAAGCCCSCYVRRVSSRGGISRGSSRGGLSMAVEEAESGQAEARQAGAAAGEPEQEEEEDQPSDLHPASNLSAEADHLQSRMAVGRVTSLGLAK